MHVQTCRFNGGVCFRAHKDVHIRAYLFFIICFIAILNKKSNFVVNNQDFFKMEKKHGGKREGAGRKSKTDELTLIEMMDTILSPTEYWNIVGKKAKDEDKEALKLWANYRFGMPKQTVATEGNMNITWNETLTQ